MPRRFSLLNRLLGLAIISVFNSNAPVLAQDADRSGSLLPTDIVQLRAAGNANSFGEKFQLRVLEKLPPRFYLNANVETTFRDETNPFQFPTKRKFLEQIYAQTPPPIFQQLDAFQQGEVLNSVRLVARNNIAFRVIPNVTVGWALTPGTRAYCNYFMIRDQMMHSTTLNSVAHSLAWGAQHDFPLGRRASLQADGQFREFFTRHGPRLFDFLPSLTLSYSVTPNISAYVNTLLQLRGDRYFQAPTREIDPFYTVGVVGQRGNWTFSTSGTFIQNFRRPFGSRSGLPVNAYSAVLDFEVSKRLTKRIPGLQTFVRAEPIYNMHTHNRPGLAGMDFRLYWGLRMALSKPALYSSIEQMRQQLKKAEAGVPVRTSTKSKQCEDDICYVIYSGITKPEEKRLVADAVTAGGAVTTH